MADETITMLRSARVLGKMRAPGDVVENVPAEIVRGLEALRKCVRGKPAVKTTAKATAAAGDKDGK